jgi:hypothetical protein
MQSFGFDQVLQDARAISFDIPPAPVVDSVPPPPPAAAGAQEEIVSVSPEAVPSPELTDIEQITRVIELYASLTSESDLEVKMIA